MKQLIKGLVMVFKFITSFYLELRGSKHTSTPIIVRNDGLAFQIWETDKGFKLHPIELNNVHLNLGIKCPQYKTHKVNRNDVSTIMQILKLGGYIELLDNIYSYDNSNNKIISISGSKYFISYTKLAFIKYLISNKDIIGKIHYTPKLM
jgi:hypothetical protein